MTINNILEKWNINIPEDMYFIDYLIENKKTNCFFIDKLPLTVSRENGNKFDQIDIFYQEVLDGKASKEDFLKIEIKYRNAIIKFWMYNRLYVILDVETVNKKIIKDILEPQYQKYLSLISDTNSETIVKEVLEKEELEFWIQIGIRDAAFPVFYFEDYKLLLTPSWSCYVAYLHKISKRQIVKEIVISEGLFVRNTE